MNPSKLHEVAIRLAKDYGIHLNQSPEYNKYHREDQKEIRKAVYDILWSYTDIK